MALSISLKNLPSSPISYSSQEIAAFENTYQKWVNSDFAGYRRILDSKSVEYPPLQNIQALVKKHQTGSTQKKITHFVILGTGGSSLGAEAILTALRSPFEKPHFYFLDNNDPDWMQAHLHHWPAEETLFYAVSKSGSTPETWTQLLVAIEWLQKSLPKKNEDTWKQHIVICTDPNKGDLLSFAKFHQLSCLPIPSAVGGRFSVLTAVGLFPSAFAGLSPEQFLAGATKLVMNWEHLPLQENPVFQLAHALHANNNHKITISFSYSSYLKAFGRWLNQLWAESLGKSGTGYTPFASIGTTDQHSQIQLYMEGPRDKVIAFHEIKENKVAISIPTISGCDQLNSVQMLAKKTMQDLFSAELHATRDALTETKVPNFTICLDRLDEENIGALLFFWEWLTVYTGALLKIDPFTQPGVEKGKVLTKKYLAGLKN